MSRVDELLASKGGLSSIKSAQVKQIERLMKDVEDERTKRYAAEETIEVLRRERDGWKAMQDTLYYQPLAASQAREPRLREALEKINKAYDEVSDGIQGDLESGVKWLNQEVARKFNREYPGVVKALDILLDASITADEALALPQDDTALKQYGAEVLRRAAKWFDTHCNEIPWEQLRRMADELEGKT